MKTMPLRIIDGLLAIEGDPRTAGMARITLDNGYKVIVRVVEIQHTETYGFSPVEQTLPPRFFEEIEPLRQLQRMLQANYFDTAFSGNRRARTTASTYISLLEEKLKEPLICTPIRERNLLTIWAPELPDSSQYTLEVGTVARIEL
jgi:hypothetical protein